MKFGLMSYDYTTNLGNEIQSIAARRFLPEIDYYIDHEQLDIFKSSDNVKMIMNGWYLDCLKSWPPSDSIEPLLISMHFTSTINDTKSVISSKESKDFFSSYGPVGCRDYATVELLNELDIDNYYSGCLTLTLDNDKKEGNDDYSYIVVNVANSKEVINYLKTKTDMDIYDIHQESVFSFDQKYLDNMPVSYNLSSFYDCHDKFFIAENLLKIYENAHCVITDRVHCAFPCLAFNTPVLFFNSANFAPERFGGINELVLESNFEEYKHNYDIFDVENPPKNKKDYLKIRKSLISKTKKFTGHMANSYESYYSDEKIRNYQLSLLTDMARGSIDYMYGVINLSKKYETEISNQKDMINNQKQIIDSLNNDINNQKQLINEMKNSNSWKLTYPIRKLNHFLKNLR